MSLFKCILEGQQQQQQQPQQPPQPQHQQQQHQQQHQQRQQQTSKRNINSKHKPWESMAGIRAPAPGAGHGGRRWSGSTGGSVGDRCFLPETPSRLKDMVPGVTELGVVFGPQVAGRLADMRKCDMRFCGISGIRWNPPSWIGTV